MNQPMNGFPVGAYGAPPGAPTPGVVGQYGGAPPQYGPPPGYGPPQGQQGFPQPGVAGPTSQMGQQPNFNANPFAGLVPGEAAMTRYPYLEPISPVQPATYKLALAKVRCHRARTGKMFYIVEADIVESNNPQRPAGMRCSAMIDMNNQDTWRRHVIGFLAAVYGVEPGAIVKDSPTTPWDGRTWEAVATASVHDSNPLVGCKVGCVSSHITTKVGKPFTLNDWRPADKLVVPPVAPPQTFPTFVPPQPAQFAPPQTQYAPPQQQPNFGPPQQQYAPPQQQYAPPQQQPNFGPPQQQYAPPPQQGFPPPGFGG